jgi:hypothetical protein
VAKSVVSRIIFRNIYNFIKDSLVCVLSVEEEYWESISFSEMVYIDNTKQICPPFSQNLGDEGEKYAHTGSNSVTILWESLKEKVYQKSPHTED